MLGLVAHPRHFIFILNVIRQAGADLWSVRNRSKGDHPPAPPVERPCHLAAQRISDAAIYSRVSIRKLDRSDEPGSQLGISGGLPSQAAFSKTHQPTVTKVQSFQFPK
jgi:hypothetical protein